MPLVIIDEAEEIPVTFGDATIYVRRLPDALRKEIEQKYRVRRKDNTGRPYYEIPAERADEHTAEIMDYVIRRWENVLHPITGAPVPCDATTKMKLGLDVYERINEALRARP